MREIFSRSESGHNRKGWHDIVDRFSEGWRMNWTSMRRFAKSSVKDCRNTRLAPQRLTHRASLDPRLSIQSQLPAVRTAAKMKSFREDIKRNVTAGLNAVLLENSDVFTNFFNWNRRRLLWTEINPLLLFFFLFAFYFSRKCRNFIARPRNRKPQSLKIYASLGLFLTKLWPNLIKVKRRNCPCA